MSRPVSQAPSTLFGVRLSDELAMACERDWKRRGLTKREFFERALEVELGPPAQEALRLERIQHNLPVIERVEFEPSAEVLELRKDPERLMEKLLEYASGTGEPNSVNLSKALVKALREDLKQRTDKGKVRKLFEHALFVEMGLLPSKSPQTAASTPQPAGKQQAFALQTTPVKPRRAASTKARPKNTPSRSSNTNSEAAA